MQEFQVLTVLVPALRIKAHRWTPTAEVRKILFIEKRREKQHGGECRGPGNQWCHWSGCRLGFIAFLCIAEGGDAFQMQMGVS
jgi:hypothetical protein